MNAVDAARTALNKAIQVEEDEKKTKKQKLFEYCVGKCFKHTSTTENTSYISYVHVLEMSQYLTDAIPSEEVSLSYSIPGYIIHMGSLRYLGVHATSRLPIKKHYANNVVITPSTLNHFSYFRPESTSPKRVYANSRSWIECTREEFNEARDKCLQLNEVAKTLYQELTTEKNYAETHETFLPSPSDKELLSNLLVKVEKGEVNLQKLLYVAKKDVKLCRFNGVSLSELAQYRLDGDPTGLNLVLQSTDGGTEYEPYVTGYEIEQITIDWAHVLYNIRKLLKSVNATVLALKECKPVYDISNWSVEYSGQYDVTFNAATLNKSTLKLINDIIFLNLK